MFGKHLQDTAVMAGHKENRVNRSAVILSINLGEAA